MKSDCTTCYYFISFRDQYFGDLYEPEEYGTCDCKHSQFYGNNGAGEDIYCDNHETKKHDEI